MSARDLSPIEKHIGAELAAWAARELPPLPLTPEDERRRARNRAKRARKARRR